jgi:hypothetical protein
MSENVTQIIDSFSLNSKFNQGVVATDRLLPAPFERSQSFYLNTWREIQCAPTLNWGSVDHSFQFPASVRICSSMFLRVQLPLNAAGWLSNVGAHIIKSIKIKSGGRTPIFYDNYAIYLQDYIASLSDEGHRAFSKAYMGGYQAKDSETQAARTVFVPILLPNSHFLHREQRNSKSGYGCLPCNFENNKLEVCVTLNNNAYCLATAGTAASLVGNLTWCIREVQMSESNMVRYESARGSFSQITRQMTTVHGDNYRYLDGSGSEATEEILFQRLTGTLKELQIHAVEVESEGEEVKYLNRQVHPTKVQLWVDSILVREYKDTPFLTLELFKQGFVPNLYSDNCARICFGSHTSSREFTGGFNMQNSSNIRLVVTFDKQVRYQVRAVRLENITIDSTGTLRSSLE